MKLLSLEDDIRSNCRLIYWKLMSEKTRRKFGFIKYIGNDDNDIYNNNNNNNNICVHKL
jgi:hypothetical protein